MFRMDYERERERKRKFFGNGVFHIRNRIVVVYIFAKSKTNDKIENLYIRMTTAGSD